jgi:hypothetical protein
MGRDVIAHVHHIVTAVTDVAIAIAIATLAISPWPWLNDSRLLKLIILNIMIGLMFVCDVALIKAVKGSSGRW